MVVAAAVVIILAVLSAFVWPGWAIQKNDGTSTTTQNSQQKTESSEPTKPTIDATALPDDASELLKAMPGSVLNYARTKADASTTWNSASPLEEYTLTYSTGDAAKDVTLVAAQWSSADNARPSTMRWSLRRPAMSGIRQRQGFRQRHGRVRGEGRCLQQQERRCHLAERYRGLQATGTKERSIASTRSSRCSI